MKQIESRSKLTFPVELVCPYLYSDPPTDVRVTIDGLQHPMHLTLSVADARIGKQIQKQLERYSYEKNGDALAEREHKAIWKQIKAILAKDKISYEKLEQRDALLSRRAIEALMELCDKTERHHQETIQTLFSDGKVARPDRAFVARWLMKHYQADRDSGSQLGLRIYQNATPAIADELVPLINDRRCVSRGCLCRALVRAKHPRAAEVIAAVVTEDGCEYQGLESLGILKAAAHADQIRKLLRHEDPDIRRKAKKTLDRIGCPVATPPKPVHLVKSRSKLPKGLAEWSANLDMEQVEPTLKHLTVCIDKGFGPEEIAEIIGVAELMRVEQTRVFQFPITAGGERSELWVVIFMDDEDSPDLEVYGSKPVISKLEGAAHE